jgi:hypothetical protein
MISYWTGHCYEIRTTMDISLRIEHYFTKFLSQDQTLIIQPFHCLEVAVHHLYRRLSSLKRHSGCYSQSSGEPKSASIWWYLSKCWLTSKDEIWLSSVRSTSPRHHSRTLCVGRSVLILHASEFYYISQAEDTVCLSIQWATRVRGRNMTPCEANGSIFDQSLGSARSKVWVNCKSWREGF